MKVMMPELRYSEALIAYRKASAQLVVDEIVVGAARRARSLPGQDAIVIAVIGDRLAAVAAMSPRGLSVSPALVGP